MLDLTLAKFLKEIIKKVNAPILVFAIGIIVLVALLGQGIPPNYTYLVYAISIGAMVGHLATIVVPLLASRQPKKPSPIQIEYEAGTILCVNVQGFSSLNFQDQEKIIHTLQTEIQAFFDLKDSSESSCCWLNFLGSSFVVFLRAGSQLHKPPHELVFECLALGILLQRLTQSPLPQLDIVLYWEDGIRSLELGGHVRLYGPALHDAQSLIAVTEGSRFLVSNSALEKIKINLPQNKLSGSCGSLVECSRRLLGGKEVFHRVNEILENLDSRGEYHFEPLTLFDRHKRSQHLFNFYLTDQNGGLVIGNKALPPDRVTIEFQNISLEDAQSDSRLMKLLIESDQVTLIDTIHKDTAKILAKAYESRQEAFWESIDVIFANEKTVRNLVDNRTQAERLSQWKASEKDVQIFFESKGPQLLGRWKCLESEQSITITGGRFAISDQEASIRFAPIVPGKSLLETPYIEVFKGLRAFDYISSAFDIIETSGIAIGEWDLFGRLEGVFKYHGIVRRAQISSLPKGYCFPVVLIMLYMNTIDGLKSIIQERTVFNATSDIGTFSNISGRLSARDVDNADRFYVDINSDNYVATQEFNRVSGWSLGHPIPDAVWKNAAVREIEEELGIEISADRLEERAVHHLQRDDADLYFKLFSLELKRGIGIDEFQQIQRLRPYSNLKPYTISELKTLHREEKLNRLLQRKFDELFIPIFAAMKIAE